MENDINTQLMQAMLAAPLPLKKAGLKFFRRETAPPTGPIFITGAGGARLLGVGRTTFRRWAKMAGIKPVEVFPKCVRYRRADVEAIAQRAGAVS